jgi:hypothetical protein
LRFSPSNSELAKTVGTTRSRIAHFMRHFQQLGWLSRRPELWVRPEGLRGFLQSAPAGLAQTRSQILRFVAANMGRLTKPNDDLETASLRDVECLDGRSSLKDFFLPFDYLPQKAPECRIMFNE